MTALKARLKKILEKTVGSALIKKIHFSFERNWHFFKNHRYKKRNPQLAIPPDQWLFETFQLDYQKYFEDGNLAAKEILNWTAKFLPNDIPTILDWGCGTGRIIQNLHLHHPYLLLYGADINNEMTTWNHQHIKGVHFSTINIQTPTQYPANYFDLIYGISVFTHLPANLQMDWVKEMFRITKPSGIFLITTMGTNFLNQLLPEEKKQLQSTGYFAKIFQDKSNAPIGDRNFSTYETPLFFETIIADYFNIIQYFEGKLYPEKFGGQDLWILQKK